MTTTEFHVYVGKTLEMKLGDPGQAREHCDALKQDHPALVCKVVKVTTSDVYTASRQRQAG